MIGAKKACVIKVPDPSHYNYSHQTSPGNTDAAGTSIKSNYQVLFLKEDKHELCFLPVQVHMALRASC